MPQLPYLSEPAGGKLRSEVDQREPQCLKLTLELVDREAYNESLRIIVDLLKLIGDLYSWLLVITLVG